MATAVKLQAYTKECLAVEMLMPLFVETTWLLSSGSRAEQKHSRQDCCHGNKRLIRSLPASTFSRAISVATSKLDRHLAVHEIGIHLDSAVQ